jgi:hypothetical protein
MADGDKTVLLADDAKLSVAQMKVTWHRRAERAIEPGSHAWLSSAKEEIAYNVLILHMSKLTTPLFVRDLR